MIYSPANYSTAAATNNKEVLKAVTRVTLTAIGLLLGTGSVSPTLNTNERAGTYRPAAPTTNSSSHAFKSTAANAADLMTAAQHLAKVKSHIGLSISELASFFGLTRQAVYKWQSGSSSPDAENIVKLKELSRLADGLSKSRISRPSDLAQAKAFNGRSILDLIKANEDYAKPLAILINEYKIIDKSYAASRISSTRGLEDSDWKSSISIPSASEA